VAVLVAGYVALIRGQIRDLKTAQKEFVKAEELARIERDLRELERSKVDLAQKEYVVAVERRALDTIAEIEKRVSLLADKVDRAQDEINGDTEKMVMRIEKKIDENDAKREATLNGLAGRFQDLRLRVEIAFARTGTPLPPEQPLL
jgi:hypothetical protein